MTRSVPDTVVFDLGGVLIDWDPRYLYRTLLPSDDAVERFLTEVTTAEWNHEQDRGRPWDVAVKELTARFPEHAELIAAYRDRWVDMLGGEFTGMVDILRDLGEAGIRRYALTNWSAETFPLAQERFEFLAWFDGVVVSGAEQLAKPDPRIFQLLLERYGIDPASSVYLDDMPHNVDAARAAGMVAWQAHGTEPARTRAELVRLGVLPA